MVIFSLVFYMPVQFQTFNIPCLKKILDIIVHRAVLRKARVQDHISYNYLVKFNDLLRFHTHTHTQNAVYAGNNWTYQ